MRTSVPSVAHREASSLPDEGMHPAYLVVMIVLAYAVTIGAIVKFVVMR